MADSVLRVAKISLAAQHVAVGLIDVERDGAREILDGLVIVLDVELRFRAVAIAGCKASISLHGAREIADRGVRAMQGQMSKPPPAQRRRAGWHQLDGLGVIDDGVVDLRKPHIRAGPVVVGGRIPGREHDRAIEILHGLLGEAEREQQIAAIVVDGGELGKQLRREIEILERLPRVPELDVGDAAIVEDRSPAGRSAAMCPSALRYNSAPPARPRHAQARSQRVSAGRAVASGAARRSSGHGSGERHGEQGTNEGLRTDHRSSGVIPAIPAILDWPHTRILSRIRLIGQ